MKRTYPLLVLVLTLGIACAASGQSASFSFGPSFVASAVSGSGSYSLLPTSGYDAGDSANAAAGPSGGSSTSSAWVEVNWQFTITVTGDQNQPSVNVSSWSLDEDADAGAAASLPNNASASSYADLDSAWAAPPTGSDPEGDTWTGGSSSPTVTSMGGNAWKAVVAVESGSEAYATASATFPRNASGVGLNEFNVESFVFNVTY